MEYNDLLSRLQSLTQKSRKALRLYSSMAKPSSQGREFAELQLREWRDLNAELVKQLLYILERRGNVRKLTASVFALRDQFHGEWRSTESELHLAHKELIYAAETGDFVRSATLARNLVVLKARAEAAQAVHHELQGLIDQCRLSPTPIELNVGDILEELTPVETHKATHKATVIPLLPRPKKVQSQ